MSISELLEVEVIDARRELEAKLADVDSTLHLLSTAIMLRPRLSDMLRWEVLQGYEQKLAEDFIEQRDASLRTASMCLLVVCYGSFENFLRELVEGAILAISSGCDAFEKIPERLRRENIYWTGQVLQTVKSTGARGEYDYTNLARALGTCVSGELKFSLNASCFSFSHGIMGPDNMERFLDRMGVRVDWDRFGGEEQMKDVMGERRTRDCTRAVRRTVESLVRMRNIVSHTGSFDADASTDQVSQYTKLLPLFARYWSRKWVSNWMRNANDDKKYMCVDGTAIRMRGMRPLFVAGKKYQRGTAR